MIFSRGRPSENKLPTKEVFNFRIGHGYNLADGDIEDDIRGLIAGSGIETVPPNLYISSSTPQGFCDFKKYIAQHLDPLSCRELSIMNKWWISAMMYSDCRFKSIMEAQLNSFQTHNTLKDTSKGTLSLRSGFDYSRCVQEVLEASMPDRIVFLLWVSAYGTEAMWDAFISAGVDLHEGQRPRPSYLECAARAHNLPTFQFLLKAGARSTHGLRNFVVLDDASEDDIHFVEGLLQHGFPPSELKDGLDEPISYLFMYFHAKRWLEVTTQSLRIVAQKLVSSGNGSYSHPPYHRSYYLGPDVLRAIAYRNTPLLVHLIEMGASLEYVGYGRFTNGYTALQTALELGYSDVLKALLSSATGYAERKSALLLAYSNARLNLDSSHPRRAREIEPYLEHNTGYHDLEYSYWAHYPERLGASYEIDLECHHLICSALKDLGVDVPFASQQDSAGGDDIGHRYVASKCHASVKFDEPGAHAYRLYLILQRCGIVF